MSPRYHLHTMSCLRSPTVRPFPSGAASHTSQAKFTLGSLGSLAQSRIFIAIEIKSTIFQEEEDFFFIFCNWKLR